MQREAVSAGSKDQPQPPQPPQPPEFPRRAEFHLLQLIGVPLLMVLPVLALFGVFGESFTEAEAAGPALALNASYPGRTRYGLDTSMQVRLRNTSGQPLETVRLRFARRYIDSFANAAFTPSVTTVDGEAYQLELHDIGPGETRQVKVDFRGDEYGRHAGKIAATTASGETIEADLSTFVFP